MSINVTVSGNPISIRRGKMVLSDLENIKRIDREHRKRLRREQVQEQSKAVAKRLLERARRIRQDELDRLEKDSNTQMKRAHDKKLMEIHRRYQDIENIGYAYENATNQPDIESIKQAEEERNKAIARARGVEAAQRLQEFKNTVDPKSKHQERLNLVGELEKERSHMVAQLPKKPDNADFSGSENIESEIPPRRKVKHVISKKTPIKKVAKQSKVHHPKTPSRLSVTINGESMITSSKKPSVPKSKKSSPSKSSKVPTKVSDITEGNLQSDDNEPRKTVPVTSSSSSKPTKFSHADNYEINSSSDLSSTSSTSSSNDSSYYSDSASKKHRISPSTSKVVTPITSKVDVYDHNTRQRNTYDMPCGVVERTNTQYERSAEELARELRELEEKESASIASQRERARQRSQIAMIREKVKKDYKDLIKKLEEINKLDLMLQAKKTSCNTDPPVLAPSKKCKDDSKRQKRINRTFETLLRNSKDSQFNDRLAERPITITPRDYVHSNNTPVTDWKEPPYEEGKGTDDSCSETDEDYCNKKMIIDMLMKIEKSKRQLLQEYGDDLPDNVFNTVVKSVNQPATPVNPERNECHNVKHKTPTVQVINMSGCDESKKSAQKIVYKPKKPCNKTPARTISRPCRQSSVKTCDQQTQVELQDEKTKDKKQSCHPIEPVIKIITPENVDSSTSLSSNSSTATDLVVDVNQQGITVDPKDRDASVKISKDSSATSIKTAGCKTPVKISFEKQTGGKSLMVTALIVNKNEIRLVTKPQQSSESDSQKQSPIVSGLSHSLPESRKTSPSKKLSRSAPPTRHSSPKKSPSRSRVASARREATHYSTQYTQVSIDSSTESSQLNSTTDLTNGSKLYTRFQALAAKRIVTTSTGLDPIHRQPQDTSDASTIYASPPAAAACAMLNDMNSSTPILELLDSSSTNEAIRRKARQVSPVSSPETPSPRTMKLPSNIPRTDFKVSRNLKFATLHDQRGTVGMAKSISKSARANYVVSSLGKTPVSSRTPIVPSATMTSATTTTTTATSSQPCSCRNPTCKLLHQQAEDTHAQLLAHCPEILKTYEDLQNVYTERIASLTDLIELVRNEQKGLEMSVMAQDSAKFTSRSDSNSQSSVSGNLIKNIEAIHAQLQMALQESQKMISGEAIDLGKPIAHSKTNDKTPSSSIDLSKNSGDSGSLEEEEEVEARGSRATKPRVLNDERVNISLSRYQNAQKSRPSTSGQNSENRRTSTTREVAVDTADQNENLVEMLSKEILEQSKNINKPAPVDTLKDSDDSLSKPSQAAVKDSGDSSKNAVSTDEQNQSANLDTSNSDFVPFLAGIPKISRGKTSSNGRGRPPVTLISGMYMPEMVSPAHELSTIVEFDTPDTANKSQASTRSPSNKARKKLLSTGETVPSTSSSPSKKVDAKITKNKPSLQVAPLPIHQSPHMSLNVSNKSVIRSSEKSPKKSLEKSPRRSLEKSPKKSIEKSVRKSSERLSESLDKKKLMKGELGKNLSSDSMQTLPDLHIEHLQQSQDNADGNYEFRISQISELQSLPDEDIDQMLVSELCEESKSKSITPEQKQMMQLQQGQNQELQQDKGQITLTSTASLSGISVLSEISSTPSSDVQQFKCPSSSDEMELAFKKWGLGWTIPTLKKTREASALGSSSSSDITPVNTGTRLVTSAKKHLHDSAPRELFSEISDVSSISIRHENKSTEKSVLVKGRTSTPNRLQMMNLSNNSNHSNSSNRHLARNNYNESNRSERTNQPFVENHPNNSKQSVRSNRPLEMTNNSNNSNNSDGSTSLGSFSSDLDIVVQNQSADMSVRNISFSNNNLG